jgi:LysM repeat protein
MNKKIQIRRNKPSGTHYRVLYAKTGRKRRLHAATTAAANRHAGMGVDVPGIGVGRALFVILILHVLAIAAIFIHSNYPANTDNETADKGQGPLTKQAAVPVIPDRANTGPYIVVTGDTYRRIAENRNVSERALRALNNDRALRAGLLLDLPAELSSRPVDPTPKRAAVKAPEQKKPRVAQARTTIATSPKPAVAKPQKVARVAEPAKAETLVVKPAVVKQRQTADDVTYAPKAIVIEEETEEPAGVKDSGKAYTIAPGDTLTRIAKRFKVSQKDLLDLNGIKDPNKLFAGRRLKIPTH